jgi:DNA polymerase-1
MRCEGCPFKTRCIGTKGPEDSPFVIVGESPGNNELREGKPFVGDSGKMLDSVLNEAGLKSLGIEPYVINALSCYPPASAKQGAEGKKKMEMAVRACQSRVVAQITAHPRKVILCLGAAATWSVTNDYKLAITRERGRIVSVPYAEHGAVLAVHPAFLMRNGGGLPFWKKDLGCAVRLLRGEKGHDWVDPTWSLIERPSQIIDLMERCHAAPYNTSDLETDQLHWYGGRILCAGITNGDGDHVWIIPEHVIYANLPLMRKLYSKGIWAWHNSLFDVTWLNAPQHEIPATADIDTMLMSYARNENRGFHDLDQVAQELLGAPKHKGMLEQYLPNKKASYRNVPPEILYKYNAIDLKKQHLIKPPLQEIVDKDPHTHKLYHNLLIRAVPEIVRMRLRGVKVDVEKVRENEKHHIEELAKWDAQINKFAQLHIGKDINCGSSQQLAELLYDKMGLKIPGTRSTDEDTIIQLQRRYDHPIFNMILNRREIAKRKGTYVTNLLQRKDGSKILLGQGHMKSDGYVYPDFALHRTTTGRLAGADPNFLNQPRGPLIRGQYIARPGKLFVEVDENQAELRSLAVMSGDPLLLDIYTKNEISIHDVTTSSFFGSLEEMKQSKETLERAIFLLQYFQEDKSPENIYKEAKMRGKAVNFGVVYGREAYSLAMEFNISVKEADRWIRQWMETYPGAARFIEWCRRKPLERRDLITVFGRKKRHGVVSREALKGLQNEAANFPHQSTASDIMLETVIRVGPRLREEWDAHIWNEVYDAVYYEIDIDERKVAESIKFVQDTITAVPLDYGITRVPFLGDAKVGFSWGTMKDWKGSIAATLGEDALAQRMAA